MGPWAEIYPRKHGVIFHRPTWLKKKKKAFDSLSSVFLNERIRTSFQKSFFRPLSIYHLSQELFWYILHSP